MEHGPQEAPLQLNPRVLLIEHLDATGAAPADARARALACRSAGAVVEALVLDSRHGNDLQFPTPITRAGTGTTIEVFSDDETGLRRLRARVRASQASRVLWAGSAPGGGALAASIVGNLPAWWWPTGHAGARAETGSLAAIDSCFTPCGGSAWDSERIARGLLSLWDGPFVLVPTRPSPASARLLFSAFAQACLGRDELDLVVLDHPRAELETLARECGVGQRVHFVGPAPREAELAWLATARVALVSGDAPLSGGLLLRALGAGLPVLAAGAAARPIGEWLKQCDAGSAAYESVAALAAAFALLLDGMPGATLSRDRSRAAAALHAPGLLASRVAAAFEREAGGRRAA